MMYGYGYSPYFVNTFLSSRGSAGVQYLVDTYSPVAAYSLRKLSSSATNAIRVRRSGDNSEQDIGFSGDDLDTASLSSFVGANNGFVVKWYNQGTGGATYDMIQSTVTRQMKIIATGTLQTVAGLPAVRTSDQCFYTASGLTDILTYLSIFSVNYEIGNNNYSRYISFRDTAGSETPSDGIIPLYLTTNVSNDTYNTWFQGNTRIAFTIADNTHFLFSLFVDNGNLSTYLNSSSNGSYTGVAWSYDLGEMNWGGNRNTNYANGYIQEMMVFLTTDESANRTDIESNINGYYSIY